MSTPDGPWSRLSSKPRPTPPAPRRPLHLWLWLACIAGVCVLAVVLAEFFPGRLSTPNDKADLARGVLLVALVSSGTLLRARLSHALRNIAIWTAVIAVLLIGYSFRSEMAGLAARLRSEVVPSYPVASGPGEIVVNQDIDGGFYLTGQVNGQPVRFLVDTGASDIVLSPADAMRLGVDFGALQFIKTVETANGPGLGAPYTADALSIGPIQMTAVPMSVNRTAMSSSLLGMAFFNRLQSFRFEDHRLYLRPKA